jgi:hypothetical protein
MKEAKKKYCKPEVLKVIVDLNMLIRNSTGCCRCTPSCPYVYVWNGKKYIEDNTILPHALACYPQEIPVDDFYVLQEEPQLENGHLIKLQIKELEYEISHLRYFELLKIIHPEDHRIGYDNQGRLFTYCDLRLPKLCKDRNGLDCLHLVTQNNWRNPRESYFAQPGDYLEVEFEKMEASCLKLIIVDPRDDEEWLYLAGKVHQSIHVKLFFEGKYHEVGVLHTRDKFYPEIVDLSPYLIHLKGERNIKIKLEFTAPHKICCIALDVSPSIAVKEETSYLASAVHDRIGDVTATLKINNQQYISLFPGECIELMFDVGKEKHLNGFKASYVLFSRGYYTPILREIISIEKDVALSPSQ